MSHLEQLTIGVAGHIDHGKTSLVKSITGKNTDNLKEEIKRGMTINVGFAHLNEKISLIDVPGHENFIKNMVSGVCNIDFCLLVIAADDGIMPQTIEHFEILRLLDIKAGYIVINKIDLVEKEWLDLVTKDIKDYFKNSFLDINKIFNVSTTTNEGVDCLKDEILNINSSINNKYSRGVFRMFIDRSFLKVGFGHVVTGTVSSGKLKIGEKLKLLPQNQIFKVRGLQSHDVKVDLIKKGDRGAINLYSLNKVSIDRGNHLSNENFFNLVNSAVIKVNLLTKSKNKIKNNQRIRFLLGTQEVMARIFITDDSNLNENNLVAIIKFERGIIASFQDRYIIRSYSPITTIGGGVVLDTDLYGKWSENKVYSTEISKYSENISRLIYKIIERDKLAPYTLSVLSCKLGLSNKLILKYLKNENCFYYGKKEDPWIISIDQKNFILNKILKFIISFHDKNKFVKGVNKEEINNILNIDISLLDNILVGLIENKKLKKEKEKYFSSDFKIVLDVSDEKLKIDLMNYLNKLGFNTPCINELSEYFKKDEKDILKILMIERNNNNLLIIKGEYIFTNQNYIKLLGEIDKHFKNHNTLSIKEFKEISQTTRKYAVPLLEYLDKNKVTYRLGNERKKYK